MRRVATCATLVAVLVMPVVTLADVQPKVQVRLTYFDAPPRWRIQNSAGVGLPFPTHIWAAASSVNKALDKKASKSTANYCVADLDPDFRFNDTNGTEFVQALKLKCAQEPFSAQCGDGVQNGNETDTDCGGDPANVQGCPPCADGQACVTPSDCLNGHFCIANLCQP